MGNGFFKIWGFEYFPIVDKECLAYAKRFQIDPDGFNKSVDVLKGVGFSEGMSDWIFNSYPEALGFLIENRLMPLVDEFESLGFSKEFIRKEIFREPRFLGMELEKPLRFVEKPRVIIYDVQDIEKKIEFLVNTMKFNVGCLVEVPEYLGVSFDKQIVPRYNVIEYLRAKGGLGDEVGLKDMIN
ncbi:hypothetical protein GH714_032890 [Hevea brasiliensis]|uniref:Uncharacterized protein n=1 Tax=Hevea brasiliensis TaxID=3981 RepID=A0A6A6K9Z6_HEVBR|nr:hypothetical protein GH714_032890 [Hevea brasiliensis]